MKFSVSFYQDDSWTSLPTLALIYRDDAGEYETREAAVQHARRYLSDPARNTIALVDRFVDADQYQEEGGA